ncbi:MAG TPA: hypothetical protein VL463_04305 [Kofleriaceae bacterium]|nr:hypothetical protein [Kofleriaceae bacterium]
MNKQIIVVLIGGLAACGSKKKSEEGAGSAAPKAEEAAAPAPAPSGPFGAWDMDARTKAWQGAWSGDGSALGSKAAWSIDGSTAQLIEGGVEKKLEFAVKSPCTAEFTEKSADGSSSGTVTVYTIKDGQLITGLGDAGSRKGDSAVVCGGGSIFTFDGKACTEWHDDFGRMSSEPGECGFRKDGGKDVFFYKANGMESVLNVDGDVIWSDQLRDRHAKKETDLASAKKTQGF